MQSLAILVLTAQIGTVLEPGTVVEARAPHPGLEAEMPTGGAYARGLALAGRGEYVDAQAAFGAARGEFLRMIAEGKATTALGRRWIACATRRAAEVFSMQRTKEQLAREPGDLHALANRAILLHNHWLSLEAYYGRRFPEAALEADRAYHAALDGVKQDDTALKHARLGFVGLLAQLGRKKQAIVELARAHDAQDPPSANLAFAFAALGDRAATLKTLAALKHDPEWLQMRLQILVSNDFDPLRDDPDFIKIVGRLE